MITSRRTARDIRSDSRLAVLHALLSAGEASRNDLARATGLSTATVATVVAELLAEGLVVGAGRNRSGVGRPSTSLRIDGSRGAILGVDVAETYVRTVVFDAALAPVGRFEVPLDEHENLPGYVVDGVGRSIDGALGEAGVERSRVLGVGVSLPGQVLPNAGVSVFAPNWDWRGVRILDLLRARVDLPLVLDNPLKAIATAELWFGAGRSVRSLVTINLGTGVGAGIVLDGRILRGVSNNAGEWGHSLLVLDGRECRCGRRGCVEAYVGARGIQQTLAEIDPDHPLLALGHQRDFISAVAGGLDEDASGPLAELLRRTGRYLGAGVADLVAILNPERVTLTGWTAWTLGEHLMAPTNAELAVQAPLGSASDVTLDVSTVRGGSVARGMATFAFERFLGDLGLLSVDR
ncbi:ROK family transcriptional regulator [Cellulomonas marina]|uniref:Sugar kinase of the NBD/HSP70 family, may contain an N-terminal HTH domain n=1 Tax=Cellulomonas marina TaxID=988821 RepID=A0A1I1AA17_9CELL|nr:ROK family transcriptional regulator [Cellulomonas marina]GIG30400.1 sugar kinase [Cellulomonas marina]SFB34777.1 Sugar kinase of the NBD/HSP70 family, may contain an N-terminal HTH domain [Cellulomonas marina]